MPNNSKKNETTKKKTGAKKAASSKTTPKKSTAKVNSAKEEKKEVTKNEAPVEKKTTVTEKKEAKKETMTSKSKVAIVSTIIAILLVILLIAYVLNTIVKKANFKVENPVATMEIENFGTVKIKLYPEYAPNTVANFIKLANNGFYDGLTFHRTIPDFMIQGGDKDGDGTGNAELSDLEGNDSDNSSTYAIKGEFILNGFTQNTLKHKKGVISMARSDYSSAGSSTLVKKGYDTASSQFFIMTADNNNLDGAYAAFGEVIEGMDVVEKVANVEVQTRDSDSTNSDLVADRPVDPPVIKSIRVETNGVDYGMPETVEPFDYNSYMMQQYYGGSY